MAAGRRHPGGRDRDQGSPRRRATARARELGVTATSRRCPRPNGRATQPGTFAPPTTRESPPPQLLLPRLLLLQLLLLQLLLLRPVTAADACPAVCRCDSGFIYCNDRGLTAVPSGLPRNATIIYLQNNGITNEGLPATLQALSSVEVLYLYNNRLDEFPAHLPPNLRELHLQENNIEVVPGAVLERTPFLEKLHLNDNSVSSAGIEATTFHGTPRLKLLFLSRNHLSSVPRGLPKGLEELRLDDNRISRIPDRIFGQLTYLSRLALDGNILSDASLSDASFSGLPSLMELSLARNVLTTVPVHLPVLGLQKLILQDNQISRLLPGVFSGLKHLQRIDLSGNGLRSLSQGAFNGLESLTHLSACKNPWHCDCGLVWLRNWLRSRPNINARGFTCQTPERFKGTPIRDFGLKEISCISISKGIAPAGVPPMPLATVLTEADDFSSTSSSIFTYGREGGGGHAKVISSSSRIHVPGMISAPLADGMQLIFSPCLDTENSVRLHWQDVGAQTVPSAAYRISWVRLGPAARGAAPPPSTGELRIDSHEATVVGTGEFLIGNLEPRSTYRICATPLPHAKGGRRHGQFAHEQGTAEERPLDGTCVDVNTTRLQQKSGGRRLGKGPAAASSAGGPGSGGGGGGEEQQPQQQPSLLPLAGMVGGAVAAALFVALLAGFCWYVHHHHHVGSRRSAGQPLYGRAQQHPTRARGRAWSQGGRRQSWSRGREKDVENVEDEDEEDNDERAEVGYYEPTSKPGGGGGGGGSILEICETRFEAVPLNEPCCAGVAKTAYAIRTIFPPVRVGELMVYQRDTSNSSNSSNRSYRDSGIPDSDYSHT